MAEMEIHRNDRVMTADGVEVGRVKHVIVDGPTRQVTDFVVEQDGHEWQVPMSAVMQNSGDSLTLRSTGAELTSAARFDRSEYHAVDDEAVDNDAAYAGDRGQAMPGAATLEHAGHNDAVIDDERGMTGRNRGGERLARRETGKDYSKDDTNITVPIVEEQLKAGVRESEAGRARIVKDVREEQQTLDVPVQREEVYVTERSVNRPATEADLKMRERDIEIPLREQEVVTQKQAVVTGEVNVRKEVKQETERVTDTVRREDVHVEDPNNPRVHVEGTGMTGRGTTGADGKTVTDKRQYDAQGNLVTENETVEEGTNRTR
ncbi:MAG: DUF2382 domain-containing protein [Thermomicrobiales bacterium]